MPTDIRSPAEIEPLISRVTKSADKAVEGMRVLLREQPNSLEVLHAMRFDRIGWHPLEDRVLNLVEQINQTWTCLVTLYALKFLFDRHRSAGGFRISFGTESGTDIVSLQPVDLRCPRVVAAEAFAAIKPSHNDKLRKDRAKLLLEHPDVPSRYVFFGGPNIRDERYKNHEIPGVEVWG